MSKTLKLIQSRILETPLLITEHKLHEILGVLEARIELDVSVLEMDCAYTSSGASSRRTYYVDGNVAIIPVRGTLVHRGANLRAYSGLTSYQAIRTDFQGALNDPEVERILLDVDSPGGEVPGLFDLVDEIYSARGVKPIIAMVNENGYSAAYAIASAADEIYLTRTAGVGSIGVIYIHVDKSAAEEKAGVKYTLIYKGARKTDFNPHSPISDEALAIAQDRVDEIYTLFVETVSRNTGLPKTILADTQAATYNGKHALEIGLAHKITTYNNLITDLKGGSTIMAENNVSTQPQEPTITQADIDTAVQTERNRVLEILEACELGRTPELAVDLISDGSSPDLARKLILSATATKAEPHQVNSNIPPTQSAASNILVRNAKQRAAEAGQTYALS